MAKSLKNPNNTIESKKSPYDPKNFHIIPIMPCNNQNNPNPINTKNPENYKTKAKKSIKK